MVTDAEDRPRDVADILDLGPWGGSQKRVLAMVAAAIVLDGFDNRVLGFHHTAPAAQHADRVADPRIPVA